MCELAAVPVRSRGRVRGAGQREGAAACPQLCPRAPRAPQPPASHVSFADVARVRCVFWRVSEVLVLLGKEKPCVLLFVVRWELPSVGAGEAPPSPPTDVSCSGAGGGRCFFPWLETSWFQSAGSLFFASKIQPTVMHLFANRGNCWLGNKCYFDVPTKRHRKTPSKCHPSSANIFFLLPSALNNRYISFFSWQMRNPATDAHNLEASVTVDFLSVLPKIKAWQIAYRLPLLTFHLLSFSAPSVFQSKQWIICQCFLYFLEIVWGYAFQSIFWLPSKLETL